MPHFDASSNIAAVTEPTLQRIAIYPGQPHALAVTAGSELFCSQGQLLLHSGPQAWIDAVPNLQWQLSTGQRWRAPCALWLQIDAPGGPALLQWSMASAPAEAAGAAQASTLWQRVRRFRWALWRRQQLPM